MAIMHLPLSAWRQIDARQRTTCSDRCPNKNGWVTGRVSAVQGLAPWATDGHCLVLAADSHQEVDEARRMDESAFVIVRRRCGFLFGCGKALAVDLGHGWNAHEHDLEKEMLNPSNNSKTITITNLCREQVVSIARLQQRFGRRIAVQWLDRTMHNMESARLLNGEGGVRRERHGPTDFGEEEVGRNVHVGVATTKLEHVRLDPVGRGRSK